MKKYGHLLFILLTTFLGSPVMAQNNLIGPLIGLNLANVDVDRLAVNGQDITS